MGGSWNNSILDLQRRRELVELAGGEDRVNRQHDLGKLTARERIEALFDEGTFIEIDNMMVPRDNNVPKYLGDGVITGYGSIHGRTVFASSQDFTILGGSLGRTQANRICRIIDKAIELRAPYVSINDSGGARIDEGIDGLSGYSDIFYRNTKASGVIPQISVILGPCAGGACYSPAIMDYVFITKHTGQMYITGPNVVKSVMGETVTAEELGGADVHMTQSGAAHFSYKNDIACLNGVRKLLEYLPQNNEDKPLRISGESQNRCSEICRIVPEDSRKPYDVRLVINTFIDKDSFFEVQSEFAQNIVVGFARLDGETLGIVANQSQYLAGALDINASDKGARFIRFCDCFNIPILTLVDVPAFLPGKAQEHGGIIRHGAKMLFAYSEATVPKVGLIMRKAYGGAYIAMNSKGTGADIVYSWPIAEIAVMGADGAVSIIGKKKIEASENSDETRKELINEYNNKFMNPYLAAEYGYIDEVILPEETKDKIVSAFSMLKSKRRELLLKKHGNIPL